MAWQDRIKDASYTSASGKKFVFKNWEETEESFDHKASVFRFPEKDGAEVPSLGVGEHRFPLTAFINGDDYDIRAQEFMDILAERGNGILIHPIYGRKSVQPVNIKRTDKPVTEGNQASIAILFIETQKILAKETPEDVKKKIEKEQDSFETETPDEFEVQQKNDTPQDAANKESRFSRNLSLMDKILGPIAALNDDVNAFFKSVSLSLNNNLTDLVGKPLTLASQTISLIKAPARIFESLRLRIQGYQELAQALRERATIESISNDSRNNLLETRLFLGACVAGMAETVLLEDFTTKEEALTVANDVQDFHSLNMDFIADQESKFQDSPLDLLLYGDSQQCKTLISIVELTANSLAFLSFDLQQERSIILKRERSIIELTNELYGNIENDNIELLINSNQLIGDEIILIPRGREIVYYV